MDRLQTLRHARDYNPGFNRAVSLMTRGIEEILCDDAEHPKSVLVRRVPLRGSLSSLLQKLMYE
jgi:hypothetical protein